MQNVRKEQRTFKYFVHSSEIYKYMHILQMFFMRKIFVNVERTDIVVLYTICISKYWQLFMYTSTYYYVDTYECALCRCVPTV